MAGEPPVDGFDRPGVELDRPGHDRFSVVLSAALSRLRGDPWLFAPFFVAGAFLALADHLHRRDPIPVLERAGVGRDGIHVQVEFAGYPTGVRQTQVALESLIGLELPFLLWGIGLQVLTLLVVSAAGTLTIARASRNAARPGAIGRFFGFVVGMDLLYRTLGSIDALQGMGLVGIVPLALFFYLLVRLFVVPGLLVAGRPLRVAIRESSHRTSGRSWSVLGLILLLGVGGWLLAFAPIVGTLASTVVVAPLHAVAIVVFLETE